MEYIIFADESDRKGKYFGNFYGAALVRSTHIDDVEKRLREAKGSVGLTREIKWNKMPSKEDLFEAYKSVMDCFFDFIKRDIVKIRLMFTQNINVPTNLTKEQRDNTYYLLYYQFMKHAFGFRYCNECPEEYINVKFYFDDLPEADPGTFKDFVYTLDQTEEWVWKFKIKREDIAEVDSHDHCILQCMDIILGSMCFRLNDKHLAKPPGQYRRAKKTVYKKRMYKHIYGHINEIHPHFNPGTSTGTRGSVENRWGHSYAHWLFQPSEYTVDPDPSKRKH